MNEVPSAALASVHVSGASPLPGAPACAGMQASSAAAGAVLFSAIGAAVIGALVFLPHFARLLRF